MLLNKLHAKTPLPLPGLQIIIFVSGWSFVSSHVPLFSFCSLYSLQAHLLLPFFVSFCDYFLVNAALSIHQASFLPSRLLKTHFLPHECAGNVDSPSPPTLGLPITLRILFLPIYVPKAVLPQAPHCRFNKGSVCKNHPWNYSEQWRACSSSSSRHTQCVKILSALAKAQKRAMGKSLWNFPCVLLLGFLYIHSWE